MATGTNIVLSPLANLAEGTYTFYANATEPTGQYTSPCSTASLNYEVDLTSPDPVTNLTHVDSHNDTATSPPISWDLSVSTDVDKQFVGLSTLAAGGDGAVPYFELDNILTTHTFSALTLDECTDYYATVYVQDFAGNQSPITVSTTPFLIDANDPTALAGLSLTGDSFLHKTPALNWATEATDLCGIQRYEMAIGTGDTGVDINDTMDWLDVGTPTGTYTLESGVAGANFALAQDSSYYISIRAIDNNGRISVVSTSTVFTTAPSLTLSSPNQFPDKVELSWTTPVTPGITDYSICLLYTSPSPRDKRQSRMPSSA